MSVLAAMVGYIGPGSGLTAIGATIAVLAAVLVAIFGFLWYPLRRLRRALKRRKGDDGPAATEPAATEPADSAGAPATSEGP